MKISVIAPIPLLEKYSSLSDHYHLVLTHLVHQSPKYKEFYRQCGKRGDWILLDNSAHELGAGEGTSMIISAAEAIGANEVILPDRLFFGEDTYERSFETAMKIRYRLPDVRLMGVPQGRTVNEYDRCLRRLLSLGIDAIGISKDYEVWPGGLRDRVETVRMLAPDVDIHLLGWGREPEQLYRLARAPELNIRGVDSAKPLVYAQFGIVLNSPSTSLSQPRYPSRHENFFNVPVLNEFVAFSNIQVFREFADSPSLPRNEQ